MKKKLAFPVPYPGQEEPGLSKREYFIGQALAGCCAAMRTEYLDQVSSGDKGGIHPVRAAITIADKLLEVLEQEAKS